MPCKQVLRHEHEKDYSRPPERERERSGENAFQLHAVRQMLNGMPERHQYQAPDIVHLQTV